MEEVRLESEGRPLSASIHGAGPTCVVLGHGAGGTRQTPSLVRLAEALAASGRRCVLYNFPYSEARAGRPDPNARLEAATAAVAAYARERLGPRRVVHGGRSMGGRIASQVVAGGVPADGLVFLAYPLHPPGRPEQRREAHLPSIAAPMLFVQGTRDAFARGDLLQALLARLGERATLEAVEEGDHSFKVPKRAGSPAQVEQQVSSAVLRFLEAHGL
jgi:uncharacterized protein